MPAVHLLFIYSLQFTVYSSCGITVKILLQSREVYLYLYLYRYRYTVENQTDRSEVNNCKQVKSVHSFWSGCKWERKKRFERCPDGQGGIYGERKGGWEPQCERCDTFRSWRCNGHSSVNMWQKPQGERGVVGRKEGEWEIVGCKLMT